MDNTVKTTAEKKNTVKKKVYRKPVIKETEMRSYFMLCATNAQRCAPCTALRKSGTCF
jgi:hypothetical protein